MERANGEAEQKRAQQTAVKGRMSVPASKEGSERERSDDTCNDKADRVALGHASE